MLLIGCQWPLQCQIRLSYSAQHRDQWQWPQKFQSPIWSTLFYEVIVTSRWNNKYWTVPGGLGSAAAESPWGWRGSRPGRRGSRTPAARSPRGPAAARGATARSVTVLASHPCDIYTMSRGDWSKHHEGCLNKYCDIKSQACNQRNVFLQSVPRTPHTSLPSCSPWRTDSIHSKIHLSPHQRIDHCRTKTKYRRCSLKILTWYFQYFKVLPLMWVD